MKVLITGGLGFIGSHLVDRLRKENCDVYVWDNLCTASSKKTRIRDDVVYTKRDVREINLVKHPSYDIIYHLASYARIQPSFENPDESLSNDILGTIAVCELSRKLKSKIVYAGSSSAYAGHFLNPYSFGKYTAEQVCCLYHELYNVTMVIARFFNVYGPRQPTTGKWATVIAVFEGQHSSGKPLTITSDGNQRRDFTHVDDIVSGLIALGEKNCSSDTAHIFNLGTGTNYSINEIADMFGGEKVYLPKRPGEARHTLADISLMTQHTPWHPTKSLSEYVAEFLATQKEKSE